MFAPMHHPAMKVVAPVRREMGVRTIFNILGPLTNPAGAPNILMGVFHPDLVGIQARVLQELGAERALVVWGRDGMDEILAGRGHPGRRTARRQGARIRNPPGGLRHCRWPPAATLRVADAEQSKAMLLDVLDGQARAGARDRGAERRVRRCTLPERWSASTMASCMRARRWRAVRRTTSCRSSSRSRAISRRAAAPPADAAVVHPAHEPAP
jgi:hypothetical protein